MRRPGGENARRPRDSGNLIDLEPGGSVGGNASECLRREQRLFFDGGGRFDDTPLNVQQLDEALVRVDQAGAHAGPDDQAAERQTRCDFRYARLQALVDRFVQRGAELHVEKGAGRGKDDTHRQREGERQPESDGDTPHPASFRSR